MYWQGTGKISDYLTKALHVFVYPTLAIILSIIVCNRNTQPIAVEFSQKIIPYVNTEWKHAK